MKRESLALKRGPQDDQVEIRSLRLTRTWRPAALSVPRHSHVLTCMALCVEGPFDETVDGKWTHVNSQTLIIRPGDVPHANRYIKGAPTRAIVVELLPDALTLISAETPILNAPCVLEAPRFALFGRQLEAELRNQDTASALALEALVHELIVTASRRKKASNGRPRWLPHVREFLDTEFMRSLTVAEVARIAQVHPSHLAKTFRAVLGVTIGEYVRLLRVQHAASLLENGKQSLPEIAVACGFHDQSHFSRVFKARFHLSPGRYRALTARS